MLLSFKRDEWLGNIKNDILGGLVTAISLIPEVIGFAIISGVNPITALFASVSTAIVTSITGGRPAMTSAAAGSMALIMVSVIKNHGIEYMIAATILTGVIQLLLGYLGIHQLMKFISRPVMAGFVNALAILIFTAQIKQLGQQNLATYTIVILSIIVMFVFPRLTTIVPPALIIIVASTLLAFFSPLQLQVVGDLGDMSGILPQLAFPIVPFNLETLMIILPVAVGLSLVGLIESLLTLPLVDGMTETKGDSQREVKSQGLANIVTGLLGGPAGCAMIGQSVINVKSGGRKRLSTLVAGLALLLLLVAFKGVMINIPTAALIGIMIVVALETFDWKTVTQFKQLPLLDNLIMLITIAIVVYTHNLAIGIIIGVVLNMIFFTGKAASLAMTKEDNTLIVNGLLFFATYNQLKDYVNDTNLEDIHTIDLSGVGTVDDSGKHVLEEIKIVLKSEQPHIHIK